MAITPAGQEVQLAEVVTPLPAEEAQGDPIVARAEVATTLPATASSLGLLLLTGLLALAGAIALKSPHVEAR